MEDKEYLMEFINDLLGLDAEKLQTYQMVARAFVIFFVSLILIRIAGIRTLGKQSAFDILTLLMLSGIMGRAIVTEESFPGSILAALVIMLLHRLIAWISFLNRRVGKILKGEDLILMENGKKNEKNLSRQHISDDDLSEALRKELNTNSFEKVKEIYLERSGEISITEK